MKKFLAASLAILLTGCGTLIPKSVEFGQDKVAKFPEPKAAEKEKQRQAARMAADRAEQTLENALTCNAPFEVIKPAEDTAVLTDAVAESVGPPKTPAPVDKEARAMAAELRSTMAKLASRIDSFKSDNNENTGKKIEGTGWLQIPYFVYILLVGAMVFVGFILMGLAWTFLKMYGLSNPPVQLGVTAVQAGAGFLKRALSEVVSGGEKFKEDVMAHVKDPALQEKLKEVFRISQERVQSQDTQALVQAMTPKV